METIINAKPRQAEMTIAYEKGEQAITHPTGVVSKYTVKDLEARKERLLAEQKRIDEEIVRVDKDIAECAKVEEVKAEPVK
jgi:hypothetical protein